MVVHLTRKLIPAIGWRSSVPQQPGLSHRVVRLSEKQTFDFSSATTQEINIEAAIFCNLTLKCIFDDFENVQVSPPYMREDFTKK